MTKLIAQEDVTNELFDVLTETFEQVKGIYLDRNTSLFETLDTITAEEASRPVSANCASLAAQVEHVRFYLEVHEKYLQDRQPVKVDWGEIWRTVQTVTPEAWETSKQQLKATYERISTMFKNLETWEPGEEVAACMAIVVHTAYHLGEIRQALCTLRG